MNMKEINTFGEYHGDELTEDEVVEMIAQAFVKMVDEQPSNVRIYDYALMFEDYNDMHHKTVLPAPGLPRDKEQAENVIRRVVQDSISGFADFLLQRDIVLGEPNDIEITYGAPELGVDDVPDMCNNMMRATLHVTWKSKREPKISSKKGGSND